MFKKISSVLIAVLLVAALPVSVMAALPVDEANVRVDNYQENGHEPYKMFLTDPIGDGVRFAGHVNPDAAHELEEGEPVFVNGSGTMSVVVPFTQTVNVESFSLMFINAARQYFFLVYTSMDGSDWTEVAVSENARKGVVDPTVGPAGLGDGPAQELYISTPAGNDDAGGINMIKFGFAAPATANYIKITFYGNDNATGNLEVGNHWLSFNNLSFDGTIYEAPAEVAPEPANEVAAPAPAPAAVSTSGTAPATADPISIIAIGAIISAAGIIIAKKRK